MAHGHCAYISDPAFIRRFSGFGLARVLCPCVPELDDDGLAKRQQTGASSGLAVNLGSREVGSSCQCFQPPEARPSAQNKAGLGLEASPLGFAD
ncbi:unannotated protein [freshwater metagenome]|uniref:Unannotated protein n=1 Tax=freshwater metagenome TaxID=449393 RepID=A0A6J7N3G8_9ZZZZ